MMILRVEFVEGRFFRIVICEYAAMGGVDEGWSGSLKQWWEGLPDGEDSFPDCQVKAAIWHELSRGIEGLSEVAEALPPQTRALVESPPPASTWVSEVQLNLAICVVGERLFSDWDEFYAHTFEVNQRLLSGRMYRSLLSLLSPSRIVKGCSLAFSAMHRGAKASAEEQGDAVLFALDYPPGLFPSGFTRSFPTSIRAALVLSGAEEVTVVVETERVDQTTYLCHWRK